MRFRRSTTTGPPDTVPRSGREPPQQARQEEKSALGDVHDALSLQALSPEVAENLAAAVAPGAPRVSVVIPAKNEARNLRFVLPHLAGAVHEIILVDGHSIDDTVAVARGMDPSVRVVAQVGHGKGDALRCGFEAATGDIIVTLDADGSTDPREIPRFVAALVGGADIAKGSRFLSPEHMVKAGSSDITLLRRLGNRALNGVVNMLFGTRFTDLCYGYNAFWCDCLELFEVDAAGFEVETLVSLRARKANLKIVEVPSYELSRVHGKSNLHAFSDGWRVLKTILREYRNGQEVIITRKLPISPRPTKAPQ